MDSKGYVVIPGFILDNYKGENKLSSNAKILYGLIQGYSGSWENQFTMNDGLIAWKLDISTRQAQRLVKELKDKNLIKIVNKVYQDGKCVKRSLVALFPFRKKKQEPTSDDDW